MKQQLQPRLPTSHAAERRINSDEDITLAAAETHCFPPDKATSSCSFNSRKNSTSLAVHKVPSSASLNGCVAAIFCMLDASMAFELFWAIS